MARLRMMPRMLTARTSDLQEPTSSEAETESGTQRRLKQRTAWVDTWLKS